MNVKNLIIKWFNIDIKPTYVNTIELVDYGVLPYVNSRMTGRTTRLADAYVQLLFTTGRIKVADHYQAQKNSDYLMRIVIKRLQIEHPHIDFDVKPGGFEIMLRNGIKLEHVNKLFQR